MNQMCSPVLRFTRLPVILGAIVLTASTVSAQTPPVPAARFAVIAGTAVTCTNATVVGDVGVWPGTAITQTSCSVSGGTVHSADPAARHAYLNFISTYDRLAAARPQSCTPMTGGILSPGVYCLDAAASTQTGTLLQLDAGNNPNARWVFYVDGALTGTNFTMSTINNAEPCNVTWWVEEAATLTGSTFLGSILAGAAITATDSVVTGNTWATAAATLTDSTVSACDAPVVPGVDNGHGHGGNDHGPKHHGKCNQGVGNGPEGCDPGNSNHHHGSNDENGGVPGHPGRQHHGDDRDNDRKDDDRKDNDNKGKGRNDRGR
jgi:hypothetical protein